MGLQLKSSVRAKRLWNALKVTLILMARKGLISKRRFVMDMNLMLKRGKLFRKSVTNYFVFLHHHSGARRDHMTRGGFDIQDYEFSCSNTPIVDPVFSHVSKRDAKYVHAYFPRIDLDVESKQSNSDSDADSDDVVEDKTSNQLQYDGDNNNNVVSPFNVRISNYSSEEENEIISSENGEVDNQAEEFIRRFYEQLKMQRRLQLLQ